MTGQEAIAKLKALHATALYYARQSQAGRNKDPLKATSTAAFITELNALAFDSPNKGYLVFDGKLTWQAWASEFAKVCERLLVYRQLFGYDGKDVEVVDSGIVVNSYGIWFGTKTDDPMQSWWVDHAAPTLESMATSAAINWVVTPLKEGAEALGGVLDFATPAAIVIIVILVLVLAIKLT